MIYTLEDIRQIIEPIAEHYRIPAVYIFGSYARGTATEESDIDLLVDTTGTELTSLFSLGALYVDLEEALGKHIDLITVSALEQEPLREIDREFSQTVLTERICIYDAA